MKIADDGLVKSHRLSMIVINCFRKFTYVALASNVSFFKREAKENMEWLKISFRVLKKNIVNFVISFSYYTLLELPAKIGTNTTSERREE